MVLLNISFAFAAAVIGIAPVVSGAAVPKQDSSLFGRATSDTSTWEKYHEQNGVFSRTGNCLSYIDPTSRDGTWPCGTYCKNEATKICIGPPHPEDYPWTINTNPDGERYVVGKCECDTTAADYIAGATVDFVAKGLDEGFRELGSITCEVMLNVLKEAILAGTYLIPGTGQVALAARKVAKGVKLAAKSKGGKDLWRGAVKESCKVRGSSQLSDIDQGYGVFEGAPDDI
ncbi:hypothetical protein AK830_g3591 [Neonectria ditissima]|uniref:Ecp2 effector protein domain-containing protein n=1 Tax=Neonectria ditissima TaxID=78410 RepID=A0A0N8H7W7_9HYPO|nr:hypothetical protein AK830_g3591 [Neonectria ditissima]